MWVELGDEFWRQARVQACVCCATALRRALAAGLAEIVVTHITIISGQASGSRLNDSQHNFNL